LKDHRPPYATVEYIENGRYERGSKGTRESRDKAQVVCLHGTQALRYAAQACEQFSRCP